MITQDKDYEGVVAIDGRGGKDYERVGGEIRASRLCKIINLLNGYIRSIIQRKVGLHLTVVFDVNDEQRRNEFIMDLLPQAMDSLDEQAQPAWGKMTPQQMVEHLIWGFDLSTGKATTEWVVPQEKGLRMKAFLYNDQPNSKEYMNPVLELGLPPLKHPNLAAAKRALVEAGNSFLGQSETAKKAMYIHPIFGPLSYEEWARMHFKHSIHHLSQFGLIAIA